MSFFRQMFMATNVVCLGALMSVFLLASRAYIDLMSEHLYRSKYVLYTH